MFKNSKLSWYKAGKIIECFCIDIDATRTALLLKLNRKTVNRYFLAFRRLIYLHQVSQKEQILRRTQKRGQAEKRGSDIAESRTDDKKRRKLSALKTGRKADNGKQQF